MRSRDHLIMGSVYIPANEYKEFTWDLDGEPFFVTHVITYAEEHKGEVVLSLLDKGEPYFSCKLRGRQRRPIGRVELHGNPVISLRWKRGGWKMIDGVWRPLLVNVSLQGSRT